jgi:hypothetical protein
MKKERIERNLLFPSQQFRDRVRSAARERGFRSEQAFILAACRNELDRGDSTEAMDDLARIAATLVNMAREVQSLFTLVHTQVALADSLFKIRKDPSPGRPEGRNAKQSDSGAGSRKWEAGVKEPRRSVEACRRARCIWYAIARRARTQRLEGSFASGNT